MPKTLKMHTRTVLTTPISIASYEQTLNLISVSLMRNEGLLVCPIASEITVSARLNKKLRDSLEKYDLILNDGQWIRYAIKFLYGATLGERIYGPKLMLKICSLAEEKRFRLFLCGTKKTTLRKLKTRLIKLFPNLKIVGDYSPPFGEISNKEILKIDGLINKARSDIVFIALGGAKQLVIGEKLRDIGQSKKKQKVFIPVGAAFDFISQNKKQAPAWMQDSGLEWLFRLVQEPKRLWKRYLINGPLFIILVLMQKILKFK